MKDERDLPHNLEAERAILGAVLVDNTAFSAANTLLTPATFFRRAHGQAWGALATVLERGDPADLVTLKDELARRCELEDVGGPAYIASLVDGVPRSTNVEHYARIVKDKAARRALIAEGHRLVSQAHEADDPPAAIARAAIEGLDSVRARVETTSHPGAHGFQFQTAGQIFTEPTKRPLCGDVQLGMQKTADGLNVIFGLTGDGKTQLAVVQTLAQMTGRIVANLTAPEAGTVAYHDMEWTLAPRLRAAAAHYGIDPDTLPIIRPTGYLMDLADPATVRLYVEGLKRDDIRPIEHVFDTTGRPGPKQESA